MIEKMSFLSLLVVTAGKKNTKVLILLYTYKNTKEYPLTLFLLKNVSFGKNQKLLEIKKSYSNGDVVPLTDIYNFKRRD